MALLCSKKSYCRAANGALCRHVAASSGEVIAQSEREGERVGGKQAGAKARADSESERRFDWSGKSAMQALGSKHSAPSDDFQLPVRASAKALSQRCEAGCALQRLCSSPSDAPPRRPARAPVDWIRRACSSGSFLCHSPRKSLID